ncbi:hypothetical protein DGMP_25760 [Desulfomarina profundi]|uniref:Radical SAM core domain-containing protein n=1 Tax=Desulfomarina profundi TaxID=2772557 RepID=A0A8D5FMN0_9BACT|nr:radical SAM protein [Desulfomarina profundi]BCL61883.1 hypothetical protein DGMP_25760 [Desulfomarina profundi]
MDFEPKWIAWEITRRCNLKCVHCRSSSELEAREHPDFTFDEAKAIMDSIGSYASPVLVLSGGEPLLREDVFEIAEYGGAKGFRMCLATNGTLVTDEICQKIKDVDIKMVSLSLDGAKAETHDNFRNQKGAFDGTMNAIALFKKYNIPFLINSSFTIRNRKEVPEIYQLVKKLGATAWYMFMIVPTGRGKISWRNLSRKKFTMRCWNGTMKWKKTRMKSLCAPPALPTTIVSSARRPKKEESSSNAGT